MPLTSKDITHIARLARLKTSADQAEFYATQLTRIMDLVEQMNNIDTSDVEPMAHPQNTALRLREDEVTTGDCREAYQAISPQSANGFYLVPKVIE